MTIYTSTHCALKICNEAVVEGVCSTINKHATVGRSLTFTPLAMESIIDYNKPSQSRCDELLTEALNLYFKRKNYANNSATWRFFRTDTNKHRLPTSTVSPMIGRMQKHATGLPIMELPLNQLSAWAI